MTDEIEPIKPKDIIETLNKYNIWFKKNIFTLIGILIIICLVIYDLATIQQDKVDLVNQCNDYWFSQIDRVCPVLKQSNAAFDMNLSKNNFDVMGVDKND